MYNVYNNRKEKPMGWKDLLRWRGDRAMAATSPPLKFLSPGMGGTTINRPTPPEIIVALLTAPRFRILMRPPSHIQGDWTLDPQHCEINQEETEIRFTALVDGQECHLRIPLRILVECDPGAYGHTVFGLAAQGGSTLKNEGYRCFRSHEPKEQDHQLYVLAWPRNDG